MCHRNIHIRGIRLPSAHIRSDTQEQTRQLTLFARGCSVNLLRISILSICRRHPGPPRAGAALAAFAAMIRVSRRGSSSGDSCQTGTRWCRVDPNWGRSEKKILQKYELYEECCNSSSNAGRTANEACAGHVIRVIAPTRSGTELESVTDRDLISSIMIISKLDSKLHLETWWWKPLTRSGIPSLKDIFCQVSELPLLRRWPPLCSSLRLRVNSNHDLKIIVFRHDWTIEFKDVQVPSLPGLRLPRLWITSHCDQCTMWRKQLLITSYWVQVFHSSPSHQQDGDSECILSEYMQKKYLVRFVIFCFIFSCMFFWIYFCIFLAYFLACYRAYFSASAYLLAIFLAFWCMFYIYFCILFCIIIVFMLPWVLIRLHYLFMFGSIHVTVAF
jgi:hypothetical protein